jgi:hypothetical protein
MLVNATMHAATTIKCTFSWHCNATCSVKLRSTHVFVQGRSRQYLFPCRLLCSMRTLERRIMLAFMSSNFLLYLS